MKKDMPLAIVLTARSGSERLPNKATFDILGKSLLWWITERLKTIKHSVVIVATTTEKTDDQIEEIGNSCHVPVYRGDQNDVVGRIDNAVQEHCPDADFIMRGLGDCPFICPTIVNRSVEVLSRTGKEAFAWHVPPDITQRLVYGSREFPYSRSGWEKIVKNTVGDEREHVDLWFHRNRGQFDIAYHEPPDSVYFRNYRLEVDWTEDAQMVQKIASNCNMTLSLRHIIRFLDENQEIALMNRTRVEKTGLSASYTYREKRQWAKFMRGVSVISWDDTIWQPPDERAVPIFCDARQCLLGYGWKGMLYRKNGDQIVGKAYIDCQCDAGKVWNEPL